MAPAAVRGSPAGSGSRATRPLSRVEQMLQGYYDLEGTTDKEEPSGGQVTERQQQGSEAQDARNAGKAEKQTTHSGGALSNVGASSAETQPGGGALRSALQLLNDLPYLQQSMASAVNGGWSRSESPPPPELDLDSPQFNMQAFFSSAVSSCTLRELLRLSNELEGEVRVLERDIQTLVYENYGKFLSATETVRRVRQAMSDVEGELQSLSASVTSIENSSGQLMATVHARAAGIEDLVAFRQLIEQLQLLSTLPELSRRHLQADDPETALLLYEHARVFLAEQQAPCPHLQRLTLLRRDADATAAYARKLLRRRLELLDGEANPSFVLGGACARSGGETGHAGSSRLAGGEESTRDGQQNKLYLNSADASRIVRLLVQSEDDLGELLRLYQRGRSQAAFLTLQVCFSRETPTPASETQPSESSHAKTHEETQEVNAGTSGLTLELACRRLSVQYVGLVAAALKDSLFILRFKSALELAQEKQTKDTSELSNVRRIRAAVDVAEKGEAAIDVEAEDSLLSFLSSLVDAAFSRLSAVIASAVPGAASAVRGTASLASAFESSWDAFLPASLKERAAGIVRGAQRQILLETTALIFKRAYAKVAQELLDAVAAAVDRQLQQQEEDNNPASGAPPPGAPQADGHFESPPPAAAAMAVEIARQHPADQAVVIEGCVALTDAQQLLQGVVWSASDDAETLVRRHTTPWVAGLFELFVRLAAHLTKDIPAAFSGYSEVLSDALNGACSKNTQANSSAQESWLPLQVEAALTSALECQHVTPEAAADRSHPQSLPLISLVLLRIGRSLQQVSLLKMEAIGTELFPSLGAGWLGNRSSKTAAAGAPTPAASQAAQRNRLPMTSRLRAATQGLMTAYVFCLGQRTAESSVLSIAHSQWKHLQDIGKEDLGLKPPSGTSGNLAPLLEALRHCDSELALLMEDSNRPSTNAQLLGTEVPQQTHRRLGRPLGRRRTAIEREMERLFARKQRVFSGVPFSRTKAVMGVFRIAARAILEFVRDRYFDISYTQQLQVDCAAASCTIRELVQPEDASVVDGFFDEIVASAAARCIGSSNVRTDNSIESITLLPDGDIDAILTAERNPAAAQR